ncbi:hypothetical protein BDR03DRAFT_988457, partial [Suillus americanus]
HTVADTPLQRRSKKRGIKESGSNTFDMVPHEESGSFTEGEVKFFSQSGTLEAGVVRERATSEVVIQPRGQPTSSEIDIFAFLLLRHLEMNMDDADCGPLIGHTAEILDHKALNRLLISTQQINLELSMKYTLAGLVDSTQMISFRIFGTSKDHDMVIGNLSTWFPNIWTE